MWKSFISAVVSALNYCGVSLRSYCLYLINSVQCVVSKCRCIAECGGFVVSDNEKAALFLHLGRCNADGSLGI